MKQLDVSNTNTLYKPIVKTGNFYNFKFICTNTVNKAGLVNDHIFRFKNFKNEKFTANLHEYDIGLFAVKFYAHKHRYSKERYSLTTNNGDAIKILKTMVCIMLYALQQYPNHSFCFIGNASKGEDSLETKRFKVYRQIMLRYFSSNSFLHSSDASISFYSMVNKKSNNINITKIIAELAQTEIINQTNFNNLSLGRSTM